jgi:hypothetical protein
MRLADFTLGSAPCGGKIPQCSRGSRMRHHRTGNLYRPGASRNIDPTQCGECPSDAADCPCFRHHFPDKCPIRLREPKQLADKPSIQRRWCSGIGLVPNQIRGTVWESECASWLQLQIKNDGPIVIQHAIFLGFPAAPSVWDRRPSSKTSALEIQ